MKQTWQNWVWFFFLIWYGVGIILVSLDWLPSSLQWANAVFLYLAGFLAVVYSSKVLGAFRGCLIGVFIMLLTILAESLGVHYGIIFGSYHYEKDFGFQLIGVPITIGFAWVMVIMTSMAYFERLLMKPKSLLGAIYYSSLTSIFAVTMDLIIDPVAYKGREYWIWDEGGWYYDIPAQNFLGWFFVSFVIQFALYLYIHYPSIEKKWGSRMRALYFLVILMFLVTAMVEGLWLAVVVTIIFYSFPLLIRKRMEKVK
ncbi:carotenoid biosynthesis protein [Rossellomorea aquimaris]|uniref:carotenoid biosynthesis protein n=1 Tax=Rossellomorea aquimaris TaxID=189382 RepID=UPI000B1BE585|nr:carotenoid biosynthesis protein [Rossellomorea aquimaris]